MGADDFAGAEAASWGEGGEGIGEGTEALGLEGEEEVGGGGFGEVEFGSELGEGDGGLGGFVFEGMQELEGILEEDVLVVGLHVAGDGEKG